MEGWPPRSAGYAKGGATGGGVAGEEKELGYTKGAGHGDVVAEFVGFALLPQRREVSFWNWNGIGGRVGEGENRGP